MKIAVVDLPGDSTMHRRFVESFAAFDRASTNRRRFLQAGTAAIGGIATTSLLPAAAFGSSAIRRGKSVIFVYLAGGPSHLDMYDMKPEAPADIRGEFRPIATKVSGLRVCEHLPLHAQIADKIAIVNGVETIDTQSDSVITTGYLQREQRPSLFEVAESLCHQTTRHETAGTFASSPLKSLCRALSIAESGTPAVMVTLGGSCLPHGDWDTHGRVFSRRLNIFQELRAKLPVYDRAIYDLVTDLHRRGLENDVLVVACGEFGRTPWINRYGGRDHWAPCGSVLLAGGGLRTGQVVGNTGRIGERSTTKPYTAQNVLATVYRHLGIDPALPVATSDGRTTPLLDERQVIEELV
jgi:hypothetical protein